MKNHIKFLTTPTNRNKILNTLTLQEENQNTVPPQMVPLIYWV